MAKGKESQLKFEEALKRLEKIVETLENGELSLDQSLKSFEEGIGLSRLCSQKLEEAEKKIQTLLKTKEGSTKVPFELKPAAKEKEEDKEKPSSREELF